MMLLNAKRAHVCGMGVIGVLLHGCAVVGSASGEPGVEYRTIAPGNHRSDVEELLGSPVGSWTNDQDVTFVVYQFDGGIAPDPYLAGAYLFLNIGFGSGELVGMLNDEYRPRVTQRAIVSYDARDMVLGIFEEFDKLPQDGVNLENRE